MKNDFAPIGKFAAESIQTSKCFAVIFTLLLYCQQSAVAEELQKPLPHYILMKNADDFFRDNRHLETDLRSEIMAPNESDEGLHTSALIRRFLANGYPSENFCALSETGWTLSYLVRYLDEYGLFELADAAQEKAIYLSSQPLEYLELDSIRGLMKSARYYSKTDRRETGDKIFANLIKGTQPPKVPTQFTGIILYVYAQYLKEAGEPEKAKAAYLKSQAISDALDGTAFSIDRVDESEKETFPKDWQVATAAYKAILKNDPAKAKEIIASIVVKEQLKSEHSQASLSRLIQLAKAYASKHKPTESSNLLKSVLPLTEAKVLANTRMYICAELFAQSGAGQKVSAKYWNLLYESAQNIDKVISEISLIPDGPAKEKEDRLVNYLDTLALLYFFNNEPEKAHKIIEATLTSHSPPTIRQLEIHAHRILFAVSVGQFSGLGPELEKDILDQKQIFSPYNEILAQIMDVAVKQGQTKLVETFTRKVIEDATKRADSIPLEERPDSTDHTPKQLVEDRDWELKNNLRTFRCILGQILDASGRYEEAGQVLRQVADASLDRRQHLKWSLDLGLALDGQKKYTEEIAVYENESRNSTSPNQLLTLAAIKIAAQKPQLRVADQEKIFEIFANEVRYSKNARMLKQVESLQVLAKECAWNFSPVARLDELQRFLLENEGREE